LKTCQKAKYINLFGELSRHWKNSTHWTNNVACTDVLIFVDEKIGKTLAVYLGLIHLESIITEAELNAKESEILLVRSANKGAKLYKLIQAFINQKLMIGRHNFCLTSNYDFFLNIKANTKAIIFKENDYLTFTNLPAYSNFEVRLQNDASVLEYISAVAKVTNKILKVQSDFEVIFHVSENYFHKVNLPMFSVIPFYILSFFAKVVTSKQNSDKLLSYDSL